MSITMLFDYVVVFGIFCDAFSDNLGLPIYASSFIAIVVLFLWPSAWNKLAINKTFIVILFSIMGISIISIYLGNNSINRLIMQVSGIGVSAFAFYVLMKVNNYDVRKLFKVYLIVAVIIAIIGLFQFLSSVVGFRAGYDFSWISSAFKPYFIYGNIVRVNSVLQEPSGYCIVMMPACFTALYFLITRDYKILRRWQCLIIIMSFILSFSVIGYMGMIFAVCLILFNNKKIKYVIFGIISVLAFSFIAYNNLGHVKTRIDDSYKIIRGGSDYLVLANESTFALFSNLFVSINEFRQNILFGSGLGSYGLAYQRQAGNISGISQSQFANYKINAEDANSMFLRLLAETGLFGLIIVFAFITYFYLKKIDDMTNYLWVINNGILCLFFIRLVRGGHYFDNGLFFFVWLYYFSKINARNSLRTYNEHGSDSAK